MVFPVIETVFMHLDTAAAAAATVSLNISFTPLPW